MALLLQPKNISGRYSRRYFLDSVLEVAYSITIRITPLPPGNKETAFGLMPFS